MSKKAKMNIFFFVLAVLGFVLMRYLSSNNQKNQAETVSVDSVCAAVQDFYSSYYNSNNIELTKQVGLFQKVVGEESMANLGTFGAEYRDSNLFFCDACLYAQKLNCNNVLNNLDCPYYLSIRDSLKRVFNSWRIQIDVEKENKISGKEFSQQIQIKELKKVTQKALDTNFQSACMNWKLSNKEVLKILSESEPIGAHEVHYLFSTLPCIYKGKVKYKGKDYTMEVNAGSYFTIFNEEETLCYGYFEKESYFIERPEDYKLKN